MNKSLVYPFEVAAFSLAEITHKATEMNRLTGSQDWRAGSGESGGTESINGVKFKAFEASDASMSQDVVGSVYRTIHRNRRYQLSIFTATASSGGFRSGHIHRIH